jgi:DNA polymerase alpha subunit B
MDELNEYFQIPGEVKLPPDVLGELQSILRLHSMTPQELFFKWESYCLKMGVETQLNLDTVRAFKKDIQDVLDSETRQRDKKVHSTPRVGIDVFGM